MEKTPLIEPPAAAHTPAPPPQQQRTYRIRLAIAAILAFVVVYSAFNSSTIVCTTPRPVGPRFETQRSSKVPLEIHIMSKCPDARDCLEELVLPAMEQISDKVDFQMSFIGKAPENEDGVECMHGASECLGNIVELCAAKIYEDPKLYLGFTMCLFRDYSDIPGEWLLKGCALEHGIDFDKLDDCASDDDGATGVNMLRASVQRSAELNVTRSCTIRLDDEVRCVRDAGEWKDCDAGASVETLVDEIKNLSNARMAQ